ncbi:MAG: adenylosuccinate lyase [Desulforegulaceae bacterium]|nr:adenylosuccinate lyase [Desulforegulaceae bacterium]
MSQVLSISVLDGRYKRYTSPLAEIFSEFGLIKHRVEIEINWFVFLMEELKFGEISQEEKTYLYDIVKNFDEKDANKIKDIEKVTNHDVKACEYFLKEKFDQGTKNLSSLKEWIHFACTSEDINNTSYCLMIKRGREKAVELFGEVLELIESLGVKFKAEPMMSRTHGQPATPTTMGKELINFAWRIRDELNVLKNLPIQGKMNGATGNFNAHISAFPNIDWIEASEKFINKYLGVEPLFYTTQINPYSYISKNLHSISRLCSISIDLARDMWGYISLGYFKQKIKDGEVGSSTMPHKVNPIDFENSEGNFGLCSSIGEHLGSKLLVSRFQRDLSDSTVLRNLGAVFGYLFIGGNSIIKGLSKIELNKEILKKDLEENLELLAEPVQTIMRAFGEEDPYEKMKKLTRGHRITRDELDLFIDSLENLPENEKERLKKLTPETYTGTAEALVDKYVKTYL